MHLPHLADWGPTRDSLHLYSKILGSVRAALTEQHPLWWNISLRVERAGLGTGTLELPEGARCALELDLERHLLILNAEDENRSLVDLRDAPPARALGETVLAALAELGTVPQIDRARRDDDTERVYREEDAALYRQALTATAGLFERFRGEIDGDTGPVQLWPHHFDLSFEWFSERTVSHGDEGQSRESRAQIGFGFSPGDDHHQEAYYYANPWPFDEGLLDVALPGAASWLEEPWQGTLLPYAAVAGTDGSDVERLFAAVYRAAAPGLRA
jgi:hypothetical protein